MTICVTPSPSYVFLKGKPRSDPSQGLQSPGQRQGKELAKMKRGNLEAMREKVRKGERSDLSPDLLILMV